MIDENDNLIPDELEEMIEVKKVTYKERAKKVLDGAYKYRYVIAGVLIIAALGNVANYKKKEIKEALTETKDRVIFIDNMMCSDLSKMYTIANKEVTYKKLPHNKLAKGISLEDGTEVYITKYTPIKK
mgnify:CR=1 FL=1